jgi:hypothetical protein
MREIEQHENGLSPEMARAVAVLRDAPAPSETWVRHVASRAMQPDAGRRGRARHRFWQPAQLSPLAALAAGLVCALIGAGTTAAILHGGSRPNAAAQSFAAPEGRSGSSRVRFTIVAPGATRVSVVGDFNAWNPTSLPLRRSADGRTWEIDVPLEPGRYAYSFLVDGRLARDPRAPQAKDDDFGSANSVVMVRGS